MASIQQIQNIHIGDHAFQYKISDGDITKKLHEADNMQTLLNKTIQPFHLYMYEDICFSRE